MKDDGSILNHQRGQALILVMLVMTVIFVIGVIVVDFGLWLSERRGAQTDADFVALAGAWELLDRDASQSVVKKAAEDAANAYLAANDEVGNASIAKPEVDHLIVDDSCFKQDRLDAVTVDVQHESNSPFASIFGVFAPEIGSNAKACAGGTNAPHGVVPLEVDNNDSACFEQPDGAPRFDVLCPIDFRTDSSPKILDLIADANCGDDAPSGNEVSVIKSGASGTCLIATVGTSCSGSKWHDCVLARDVSNPNSVFNALRTRLENGGEPCDSGGVIPGIDELLETVDPVFDSGDPSTSLYQAKDCNSSRLAGVIVLDEDPIPDNPYPIEAFAGFYIAGCHQELLSAPLPGDLRLDFDCNDSNGGGSGSGNHNVVYGEFVNLIVENSGVGEARASTTLFSISLEE